MNEWTWADLSSDKLDMLTDAERTLGADLLLAYQPQETSVSRPQPDMGSHFRQNGLQVADLNDSQVDCLQGLEQKLQAVIIAYQQENR